MAELGFGLCSKGPSHTFQSPSRPLNCGMFEAATDTVRASRWQWLGVRGITREGRKP